MEANFNFKSQICTDKIQSERLLSLGLKKETADMLIMSYSTEQDIIALPWSETGGWTRDNSIPAWSLHRLIEIMPQSIHFENEDWYKIIYNNSMCYQRGQFSICRSCKSDLYVDIINCIEWLIKEGYFKKEYLV